MKPHTWWEEFPERLAYEQRALEAAGIAYERDESAFARGVLRWRIQMPFKGEIIPLDVTFPDVYPFFRFQVEAPTLSLDHHQNPFGKNLCLIGRGTYHWNTTDTVAGLLQEQLPLVLQTGQCEDREAVRGLEQQQAEPFSDYYPYPPSLVVIPCSSAVGSGHDYGTFTVTAVGAQGPPPEQFVRGLLSTVRGQAGEVLFEADPALLTAFPGQRLEGTWVRVPQPIRHADQNLFVKELLERFPAARRARPNKVQGGWLQIWGVAFPEEAGWRSEDGEGWVFVCLFSRKESQLVRPLQAPAWHVGRAGRRKRNRG